MKKPIQFVAVVVLIIFGALDSFGQFRLTLDDRFQIESIYSIEISDYNHLTEQFLGLVTESSGYEIVLLNSRGEIIRKKNIAGEGPGQIKGALNGLGFSPEGGIWMMSVGVIFYFNMELDYLRQQKFSSNFQLYRYGSPKKIPFFWSDNLQKNIVFATYSSGEGIFSMSQNVKAEYMLELFDTNKNQNYQLAAVSDRKTGEKIDNSMKVLYYPVYHLDPSKKIAYVTGTIDNEITVIDLTTGAELRQIAIRHGEFKSLSHSRITLDELPSSGPYTLTAINTKLISLDGDLIILDYIREISEGTFKSKRIRNQYYHHFQDPDYHRLIFFDHTKQLSSDIPFPKNGKLMIALPGNKLLFKIDNPEVEEDFIRYEVYKVVVPQR